MYPAMIEVRDPIRKAIAVYGALVYGEPSVTVISCISTVNPRITVNTAENIAR